MKRRVLAICLAFGGLACALAMFLLIPRAKDPYASSGEAVHSSTQTITDDGNANNATGGEVNIPSLPLDAEQGVRPYGDSDMDEPLEGEVTSSDAESPAFVMPEGAEYESGSALVEVDEQTDLDQMRQAFSDSLGDIKMEQIASSFVRVEYASNIGVEEAVNRMIDTGYVQTAQPNYMYHVLESGASLAARLSLSMAVTPGQGSSVVAPEETIETEESNQHPTSQDALDAAEAEAEAREAASLESDDPIEEELDEDELDSASDVDSADVNSTASTTDDSPTGLSALSVYTNDPRRSQQWALSSINAYEAWSYAKCEHKVTVAALDLGVQTTHTDLKANIVDPYNAYNAVHGGSTTDVSPANASDDHGSHVAGIISAVANNSTGLAGVSYNAYLMPVKVVDSQGMASSSELVKAYDYVMSRQSARNVRVINLSMGIDARKLGSGSMSFGTDDALLTKVREAYNKGIVTVAAAGNRNASKTNSVPYTCYPSDSANIVSVINLQESGSGVTRHDTSNYNASGETSKNISAPGTSILSTISTNAYGEKTGTSMSAPIVSAVLALEFSANPNLSASDAIKLLYGTATDLGGSTWTNTYGWGEVNAAAAAKAARDGMNETQKKKAASSAGSVANESSNAKTNTTSSVSYRTHVQRIGWQAWKSNGLTSGTTGQSLRLEGIQLKLASQEYSGSIQYRTHVQTYGWESSWKSGGATSGTTGQSKRLEAIQIQLTGEMANEYDVWYRVHSQGFGWLGWAKNGAMAGTAGYSYRLEAIQVKLLKKGSSAPGSTSLPYRFGVHYRTHVQSIGWQDYVHDGSLSGTSGKGLRMEAININIGGSPYSGSILYRAHVQGIGWQGWMSDGQMAGTSNQSRRIEALQIRLTGDIANKYDVWYRAHSQGFGWLGWAKNGARAGTSGYSYRMEAIQIRLVSTGGSAPGSTANAFHEK